MLLDRELQYQILSQLAEIYPSYCDYRSMYKEDDLIYKKMVANIFYLQSHGLIGKESILISSGIGENNPHSLNRCQITHIGMDFLADDGGLSAILNTLTIKFDTDTIKALLEARINESSLPPEDKQKLNLELEKLPAESIKHLTKKVLDLGTENLPALMTIIQSIAN